MSLVKAGGTNIAIKLGRTIDEGNTSLPISILWAHSFLRSYLFLFDKNKHHEYVQSIKSTSQSQLTFLL